MSQLRIGTCPKCHKEVLIENINGKYVTYYEPSLHHDSKNQSHLDHHSLHCDRYCDVVAKKDEEEQEPFPSMFKYDV